MKTVPAKKIKSLKSLAGELNKVIESIDLISYYFSMWISPADNMNNVKQTH